MRLLCTVVLQWQYMEHNGLMFAPPYEPHGVKIKYKGEEIVLPPEAEEVANFWWVGGLRWLPWSSDLCDSNAGLHG